MIGRVNGLAFGSTLARTILGPIQPSDKMKTSVEYQSRRPRIKPQFRHPYIHLQTQLIPSVEPLFGGPVIIGQQDTVPLVADLSMTRSVNPPKSPSRA